MRNPQEIQSTDLQQNFDCHEFENLDFCKDVFCDELDDCFFLNCDDSKYSNSCDLNCCNSSNSVDEICCTDASCFGETKINHNLLQIVAIILNVIHIRFVMLLND